MQGIQALLFERVFMKEVIEQIRYLIAELMIGLAYKILPVGSEKTGLLMWARTLEIYNEGLSKAEEVSSK